MCIMFIPENPQSTYYARFNDSHVIRGCGSKSQLCAITRAIYKQHCIAIISAKTLKDILILNAEHVWANPEGTEAVPRDQLGLIQYLQMVNCSHVASTLNSWSGFYFSQDVFTVQWEQILWEDTTLPESVKIKINCKVPSVNNLSEILYRFFLWERKHAF